VSVSVAQFSRFLWAWQKLHHSWTIIGPIVMTHSNSSLAIVCGAWHATQEPSRKVLLVPKLYVDSSQGIAIFVRSSRSFPVPLEIRCKETHQEIQPCVSVYARASRSGELLCETQFVDVRKKGVEQACLQPFILTSTCRKCTMRANCALAGTRRKSRALFIPFADKMDRATWASQSAWRSAL